MTVNLRLMYTSIGPFVGEDILDEVWARIAANPKRENPGAATAPADAGAIEELSRRIEGNRTVCVSCPGGHYRNGGCQLIRKRTSCRRAATELWRKALALSNCPEGHFGGVSAGD